MEHMRNADEILVRKPEHNRPRRRPKNRWDIFKWTL